MFYLREMSINVKAYPNLWLLFHKKLETKFFYGLRDIAVFVANDVKPRTIQRFIRKRI